MQTFLFNIVRKTLARAVIQEKEIEGISLGKKQVKINIICINKTNKSCTTGIRKLFQMGFGDIREKGRERKEIKLKYGKYMYLLPKMNISLIYLKCILLYMLKIKN